MSELELEQWTPPNSNQSYSGINVLAGDTIAVKCEQESEGLLLLKRIEIKKDGSSRTGKGGSPDTGYESDNCSRRNEFGSSRNFSPPAISIHSQDESDVAIVGNLIVEEVSILPTVIEIEDTNVESHENAASAALDLTISKNQSEYSKNSNTIEPLDYSLSPADEMDATIKMEVQSLAGISVIESVVQSRPPIDTILSCKDGKLGAHRIVLTAASKFFYHLFNGQRLEEIAVVILPDITIKIMTCLLHLAYTGQMTYTEDIQDEIFSAMECLIFGDITKLSLFPVVAPTLQPSSPPPDAQMPHPPSPLLVEENSNEAGTRSANMEEILKKEISVDDSSAEKPACSSKGSTSAIKSKTNNVIFTCSHCPRTFTKKGSLQLHTTKCHPEKCHATIGEMQMLSFCDICDRQYKTVSRAMFCYNQHGLTRCLTCLGVFPTTEIKDHYTSIHANVEGEDLVVKCRWCLRAVSVKTSCSTIASHSSVHWQGASSGQRQQEPLKVTKSRPKKKQTPETHNRSRILIFPTPTIPEYRNEVEKPDFRKTLYKSTESKKRRRSDNSDDDFNLLKNLKRNKMQVAKRTGQPVGRSGGLSMDQVCLKNITTNHKTEPVWESCNENSSETATVSVDVKNLPKIVIKLDSMKNINELIRQTRNKSKKKRRHDGEGNSKRKGSLDLSVVKDKPANNSITTTIRDLAEECEEAEMTNETCFFNSKEVKSKSSNLGLMKNSGVANVVEEPDICENIPNIKLLNPVFEKSQENPEIEGQGKNTNTVNTKSLTYPMSYFPIRLNQRQPPVDNQAKNVPLNFENCKENESLPNLVDNFAKKSLEPEGLFPRNEVTSSSYCQVETTGCSRENSSLDS